MTSTSSAADTGLPAFNRRRLAASLAVVPAALLAAPAMALLPLTPGDDELVELGRELAVADAMAEQADRRRVAVASIYDRAPEPDAIFARDDDDIGLEARDEIYGGKSTGRRKYGPKEIEAAEIALLMMRKYDLALDANPGRARKLARLTDIVDSHAKWVEARRAAWISSGMEEAERAADAAHDRCRDLRWQIVECPASTIDGVLLKVRVATACFGDTIEEAETRIAEQIEDASGEGLAFAILRDLVHLAASNAGMGGSHA